MIAIPDSSKNKITSPPVFIFLGPDSSSQVRVLNASGTQVAGFTVNGNKSDFTISRNGSPAASTTTPICTSHKSSVSGTSSMTIHGHSATLKSETRFEVMTANGLLKWRIGSDYKGGRLWHDDHDNVVARGIKKDGKLEVFVTGDEMVLDCLLAGWMAQSLDVSPMNKGIIMGVKLVGHVMGGGGA